MMTNETSAIKTLLKWWADIHGRQGNSYPAVSSVAAFREGTGGAVFASNPPRGIEVPEKIRRLQEAMELARARGCATEMAAISAWYKRGRYTITQVADEMDISETELVRRRQAGEKVLIVLGVLERAHPSSPLPHSPNATK